MISQFMTLTAKVQELSRVSDGRGGFTATWADVLSMKCSIQPYDTMWKAEFKKLDRDISHKLFCDAIQGDKNVSTVLSTGTTKRIVYEDQPVARFFEPMGTADVAEQKRMVKVDMVERDEGWMQE